jgi:hypothetical protein
MLVHWFMANQMGARRFDPMEWWSQFPDQNGVANEHRCLERFARSPIKPEL